MKQVPDSDRHAETRAAISKASSSDLEKTMTALWHCCHQTIILRDDVFSTYCGLVEIMVVTIIDVFVR